VIPARRGPKALVGCREFLANEVSADFKGFPAFKDLAAPKGHRARFPRVR